MAGYGSDMIDEADHGVCIKHYEDIDIARIGDRLAVGQSGSMRIRVHPEGPVLLRGAEVVVEADGSWARCHRSTLALCRCGRSRLGAFCDGTHRFTG
jgi:hypothetical protein